MQAPGLYDPLLAMRRCIIPPATRLCAWVWSPDRPSLLYLDWSFPSQLRRGPVVVRILLGQLFVTTLLEEQWASNTCDSTWYVATLRSKYLRFVSGEAAQEDSLQLCILTES